jgi:hypothetical protein
MSIDAVYMAGLAKAVKLSAQVEVELTGAKSEPLLMVVARGQERAIDALAGLATVDAEDPKAIRALQNEVVRFGNMIEWVRDMLHSGKEADKQLNDAQAQSARELIFSQEDAAALGLPTERTHDDD